MWRVLTPKIRLVRGIKVREYHRAPQSCSRRSQQLTQKPWQVLRIGGEFASSLQEWHGWLWRIRWKSACRLLAFPCLRSSTSRVRASYWSSLLEARTLRGSGVQEVSPVASPLQGGSEWDGAGGDARLPRDSSSRFPLGLRKTEHIHKLIIAHAGRKWNDRPVLRLGYIDTNESGVPGNETHSSTIA